MGVSAGPCSLFAWPLGNLAALITGVPNLPANTQFRPPPAKPFGDLLDHLRTCLGSIRSFLFAYLIVFYIHGDDYPAFGAATTLSWSWMWPLLVRNILSAWAVCGFWDWLMYLSPLAARFKPFKIYPKLPTWSQVRHDAFWTTIGMVCATVLEVAYCWGVANGKLQAASSLAESPNIHHTHFDCNYGTQNIGLDWLFGTFAARESDVKGLWKGKRIGLEDNDTPVFGGKSCKQG